MTDFLMLLSAFVSIVSGVCGVIGGWSLWAFIGYYRDYIFIKYNHPIKQKVLNIGYRASILSLIAGLFFFYRAYYVMAHHDDFEHQDWLLFELIIGMFMFQSSHFLVELFRDRRRIEKIVSDRNDDLLSESF